MYIKSVEEATKYILDQTALLQRKCAEENPVPQKLDAYPTSHLLSHTLSDLNDRGEYSYNSGKHKLNEAQIEARFLSLNKILDTLAQQAKPIREENLKKIEHNKVVVERITLLMNAIGIPSSYSEVDTKSRARNTKYISRPAGYLEDIRRNVKTVDYAYASFDSQVNKTRTNLQTWYRNSLAEIATEVKEAAQRKLEEKKVTFLATMRVKYKLAYDAPLADVRSAIYASDENDSPEDLDIYYTLFDNH